MPLSQPIESVQFTPPDDDGSLTLAARRNPEAFAALNDRYVQSVYRYLYGRVGSAQEAEEQTAPDLPARRSGHRVDPTPFLCEVAPPAGIKGEIRSWVAGPLPTPTPPQIREAGNG